MSGKRRAKRCRLLSEVRALASVCSRAVLKAVRQSAKSG